MLGFCALALVIPSRLPKVDSTSMVAPASWLQSPGQRTHFDDSSGRNKEAAYPLAVRHHCQCWCNGGWISRCLACQWLCSFLTSEKLCVGVLIYCLCCALTNVNGKLVVVDLWHSRNSRAVLKVIGGIGRCNDFSQSCVVCCSPEDCDWRVAYVPVPWPDMTLERPNTSPDVTCLIVDWSIKWCSQFMMFFTLILFSLFRGPATSSPSCWMFWKDFITLFKGRFIYVGFTGGEPKSCCFCIRRRRTIQKDRQLDSKGLQDRKGTIEW